MTKGMAMELAPEIRVNVICPAFVQTPLIDARFAIETDPVAARKDAHDKQPLGRIATVEECGHLVAFLASEQAASITGSVITIDGGITLGPH